MKMADLQSLFRRTALLNEQIKYDELLLTRWALKEG